MKFNKESQKATWFFPMIILSNCLEEKIGHITFHLYWSAFSQDFISHLFFLFLGSLTPMQYPCFCQSDLSKIQPNPVTLLFKSIFNGPVSTVLKAVIIPSFTSHKAPNPPYASALLKSLLYSKHFILVLINLFHLFPFY